MKRTIRFSGFLLVGILISSLLKANPQPISPNPLYLNSLPEKPWWDKNEDYRLPVLITETVGIRRRNVPVSIIYDFPVDASTSSIRVVTPYGKELPFQIKVLDKKTNKIEVIFLLDILEKEQIPLFIYYPSWTLLLKKSL